MWFSRLYIFVQYVCLCMTYTCTFLFSIGPIASVLVSIFGCRKVAIFGAILASIAFFLCTWSPNVRVMIVMYGLLGGEFWQVIIDYYFFSVQLDKKLFLVIIERNVQNKSVANNFNVPLDQIN